ncbi:MAG TPA: 23S rRNA (guanosine(2251)-2'-O)-methyltransferase RlmB [Peptococcaceae bacterium]|nr:23S rRNA (guanosine(2251)-2'-O)-methyltransferase RlmB [Peptococcaceae bacterium]
MEDLIWGRNPVLEALKAGTPVNKVIMARGTRGSMRQILELARQRGVPVQVVEKKVLDALVPGGKHQGVAASTSPKPYVPVEEIFQVAKERQEDPLILALAGWEDPQNFGGVLRSAEATGVHGVIIPAHRAVPLTGAVARVSAGAVEYVPVSRVTNLKHTLLKLKEVGLWVVGADPKAELCYFDADLTGPLVLVVGGEGKGMSPSLTRVCDLLVRIPMCGKINSLNAAVAASLILYEVLRQRLKKGRRSEFGGNPSC